MEAKHLGNKASAGGLECQSDHVSMCGLFLTAAFPHSWRLHDGQPENLRGKLWARSWSHFLHFLLIPLSLNSAAMAYSASVLTWAFVVSLNIGVSKCYFTIPLKIYPGKYNLSSGVDLTPLRRVALTSDGNGLSLASDPSGTVNFLDMVNNLQGDSGRGYYIEMSVGTPGQTVLYHKHCL